MGDELKKEKNEGLLMKKRKKELIEIINGMEDSIENANYLQRHSKLLKACIIKNTATTDQSKSCIS